jgi:hypothetical protein
MKDFNGVATKYLQNYLNWYALKSIINENQSQRVREGSRGRGDSWRVAGYRSLLGRGRENPNAEKPSEWIQIVFTSGFRFVLGKLC